MHTRAGSVRVRVCAAALRLSRRTGLGCVSRGLLPHRSYVRDGQPLLVEKRLKVYTQVAVSGRFCCSLLAACLE